MLLNADLLLCRWGLLMMVGLIAGCGVPSHMQVRLADEPQNIDKEVRFRTTYYFRVFDQCQPLKPSQLANSTSEDPVFNPDSGIDPVVLNDALYRFQMMGKASSFNLIHYRTHL